MQPYVTATCPTKGSKGMALGSQDLLSCYRDPATASPGQAVNTAAERGQPVEE